MSAGNKEALGRVPPPPLVYFVLLVVGIALNSVVNLPFVPAWLGLGVGIPLVIIGVILLSSAVRLFRRAGTPLDPRQPTTRIVTEGPYRFSRNPVYLSFTVIYLGITLATNSLLSLLLLIVVLIVIDRGVITREEKYLEQKFGEEYLLYRQKVRRWI